MKRREGVTLLELLAVVLVVGIVAAFAVSSFTNMVEKARVKDAQTTLNMIFQAERIYRLDQTPATYGTLPNLVNAKYLPAPSSSHWSYAVNPTSTDTTNDSPTITYEAFTATADRSGAPDNADEIQLDQNFTGGKFYNGGTTIYFGDHPLHD